MGKPTRIMIGELRMAGFNDVADRLEELDKRDVPRASGYPFWAGRTAREHAELVVLRYGEFMRTGTGPGPRTALEVLAELRLLAEGGVGATTEPPPTPTGED